VTVTFKFSLCGTENTYQNEQHPKNAFKKNFASVGRKWSDNSNITDSNIYKFQEKVIRPSQISDQNENIREVCESILKNSKVKNIPSDLFDIILPNKSIISKPDQKTSNWLWEYQGYVGRHKSMGVSNPLRWIKISPKDGNLIEFKCKEDCPNKPYRIIPLYNIDSVGPTKQKWLMKKSLFYWEINKKYVL